MREWRCGFGVDDHLSPGSAVREHIDWSGGHRSGRHKTLAEQLGIRLYWDLGKVNHEQFFSDSH